MLEPGVPLVLARDLKQFRAYHPGVKAIGPFHFGLTGAGDSVRLFGANADNAAPESWGASLAPYGTPGATNSLSP